MDRRIAEDFMEPKNCTIMVAWLGHADYMASRGEREAPGPIAHVLSEMKFDEVHLLVNQVADDERFKPEDVRRYGAWLADRFVGPKVKVEFHRHPLPDPTDYRGIYRACVEVLEELDSRGVVTVNTSPGTPAMLATWILLRVARFPRLRLLQVSRESGIVDLDIPFDIAAEFRGPSGRREEEWLRKLAAPLAIPASPEFNDIVADSPQMRETIAMARRVATTPLPVLLEGETGTGKELLARAIHSESGVQDGPFIAVNCGAIPESLIEAELFGYEKGSHDRASDRRDGYFKLADGGTLFLDEVGETSLGMQTRLLRALQEGEFYRVGGAGTGEPVRTRVRLVAATNRNLIEEVGRGNFREDLFYRLAVGHIRVPPLRDREGDLLRLVDIMSNKLAEELPGLGDEPKVLSPGAKKLLLRHVWPGNVRELQATLQRAFVWSAGDNISAEDLRRVLFQYGASHRAGTKQSSSEDILNLPLGEGFSLEDQVEQVIRHYLDRVREVSEHNSSAAARLLGFGYPQKYVRWLKKHGME
jgi:DNA-binding NtrC family response regulator